MNFAERVAQSMHKLETHAKKAIYATIADVSEEVVSKTPVKAGDAIGSWKFSSRPFSGFSVKYFNASSAATTAWSHSRSEQIAQLFRSSINAILSPEGLENKSFYLSNECNYILLLENGGYGSVWHYSDPFPPYYPPSIFGKPFILTAGSFSKKAPRGMVKITLLEASDIFGVNVRKHSS
jgi:hypothetical protein